MTGVRPVYTKNKLRYGVNEEWNNINTNYKRQRLQNNSMVAVDNNNNFNNNMTLLNIIISEL